MSTAANSFVMMLVGLILSSCVQGQDYQRPPVEVPDGWSRMTNTLATSMVLDRQPEAEWWKAFQNEELSGLIERALQQNHDVKRALARVIEGRASVMSAAAGLYPHMNLSSSYSSISISKNTLAGLSLATGQ